MSFIATAPIARSAVSGRSVSCGSFLKKAVCSYYHMTSAPCCLLRSCTQFFETLHRRPTPQASTVPVTVKQRGCRTNTHPTALLYSLTSSARCFCGHVKTRAMEVTRWPASMEASSLLETTAATSSHVTLKMMVRHHFGPTTSGKYIVWRSSRKGFDCSAQEFAASDRSYPGAVCRSRATSQARARERSSATREMVCQRNNSRFVLARTQPFL